MDEHPIEAESEQKRLRPGLIPEPERSGSFNQQAETRKQTKLQRWRERRREQTEEQRRRERAKSEERRLAENMKSSHS
jgi:hypothetical protein